MRVKLYADGKLRKFHVLEIPIFERHTGENMFVMISTLLLSLCGDTWKKKLISISTDGAANMVGRL